MCIPFRIINVFLLFRTYILFNFVLITLYYCAHHRCIIGVTCRPCYRRHAVTLSQFVTSDNNLYFIWAIIVFQLEDRCLELCLFLLLTFILGEISIRIIVDCKGVDRELVVLSFDFIQEVGHLSNKINLKSFIYYDLIIKDKGKICNSKKV